MTLVFRTKWVFKTHLVITPPAFKKDKDVHTDYYLSNVLITLGINIELELDLQIQV